MTAGDAGIVTPKLALDTGIADCMLHALCNHVALCACQFSSVTLYESPLQWALYTGIVRTFVDWRQSAYIAYDALSCPYLS